MMEVQKCRLSTNHLREELQAHGTIDFPCAAYASSHTSGVSDTIPWHWHKEFEIIYIKKGTLKLQIPSKEYSINAGTLAVINSNTLHYAEGAPYCELQSLVFSSLLLTGSSTSVFAAKYIQPLASCAAFDCLIFRENENSMVQAFENAFDAFQCGDFGYEFTVREQLSGIMLYCHKQLENYLQLVEEKANPDIQRLGQMIDYIHKHYSENVVLADIAEAAGIGERECLRCFKRTISESPAQYLLKYRLMQSTAMLLSDPAATISEIANSCGFDYSSYYSKQFKRFYQCTPKEYRLAYQKREL